MKSVLAQYGLEIYGEGNNTRRLMKIPIDPLSLVPAVTAFFKLWAKTISIEVHGDFDGMLEVNEKGQPLIVAVWHGEIFPIACFSYKSAEHFSVFISQSKDGEFIARILESFGAKPVRGSSSRGGVRALLKAKRLMEKEKRISVISMDGPRGPRHKAKDGVIFLAQRAGAKIVPVRIFTERKKVLNSWDRFELPLPFTRIHVHIGDFMDVTEDKLDKDVMAREKQRLEKMMHDLLSEEK